MAGGVIREPLDIDSVIDGGERVEQPGEGGGAEELLLTLEEVLSAGLNHQIKSISLLKLAFNVSDSEFSFKHDA